MTTLAFGHVLRVTPDDQPSFFFQNFFIGKVMEYMGNSYQFLPFGFSGVTVNRTGDGLETSLVFPNHDITTKWIGGALEKHWYMEVDLLILPDPDPDTGLSAASDENRVSSFLGQVVSAEWGTVSLTVHLGSPLDAVGTDMPRRTLTQTLIGNIPVSNAVRLQ